MPTAAPLEIGHPAPDFRLKGPGGQPVTLSEYRGTKNVVLVFYPLAFSPVCSHQLPGIQNAIAEIEALGAEVLGISVDNHYANQAFARKLGLSFPLLSDFQRETSAAYGVLMNERGYSGRALFVVDKQGRVAYRDLSPDVDDPNQIPSPARVIEALRALR
jgi:peroxiredoxin